MSAPKFRRPPAFTIIELMVAISIIALLFAAASTAISAGQSRGRDTRRLGDVLLISQAINQASVLSRGVYPRNATGGNDATMCADQLVIEDAAGNVTSNPAKIDVTIFPKKRIPTDPAPAHKKDTAACADMLDGYIYETHFVNAADNLATEQGVGYSLEVGLELAKAHDEGQFAAPSELNSVNLNKYPDNDASASRLRYVLNGPHCGIACYGK